MSKDLKNVPGITSVTREIQKGVEDGIFPHINKWNRDNFGPIYIPQEGKTVAIDLNNLPFYSRIIPNTKKTNWKLKAAIFKSMAKKLKHTPSNKIIIG